MPKTKSEILNEAMADLMSIACAMQGFDDLDDAQFSVVADWANEVDDIATSLATAAGIACQEEDRPII